MSVYVSRLRVLIPSCLIVWAATCVLMHGPTLLYYIGLQAMTTGVFAWAISRAEKSATKNGGRQIFVRRNASARPARQASSTVVLAK